MKLLLLLSGLCFLLFESQAQADRFFTGAGIAGTGFSTLTNSGPAEIFNNPAGLNKSLSNIAAILGYTNIYSGTGIKRVYAGVAFPYKIAGVGISFIRTGEKDFNETLAGISIGNKIRNVSLGIKANYYQMTISETQTISRLILQFGGITELTNKILFGAQLFNLNQARYSKENNDHIPVIMSAGFTWKPIQNFRLHTLIEKESTYAPGIRSGLEFIIDGKLCLRSGFSTQPASWFAGIGLISKKYLFDYAFKSHPQLGNSHHITLSYLIRHHQQ